MGSTQGAFIDIPGAKIWIPILVASVVVLAVIIIAFCLRKCRRKARYDYSILRADLALPKKLEMERKLQYDTMRETALLHCQFYLRSSGVYTPVEHLPEIGSRAGKHWFMVRDTRSKVDKLLTMVPRGSQLFLPFTSATRATLLGILQTIQHPYIYPIYDIDLLLEQDRIVLILPYNSQGSIKDVIYHAHCMDTWSSKYYMVGTGLSPHQVAKYGRQVLAGLIFLQKSGFPPICHLHSGNIILQNKTCRLSGYENGLIGLSPKLYGMTTKLLQDDKAAIEVVSFGHLIYEMAMGNELEVTIPQPGHLEAIPNSHVKQCLEFIFSSTGESYPSLEKISDHPFFKSVCLAELNVFKRPAVKFSRSQKALLKAVRRGKAPNVRKPSVSPALATTFQSQVSDNKRTESRFPPQNKDHNRRFQLPPPMSLRVKGTPTEIPAEHPLSPTPRQQSQPPPKLAAPPSKPVPPVRPRTAPAPAMPRPKSRSPPPAEAAMLTVVQHERASLLRQIRSGVPLKPVQPRD